MNAVEIEEAVSRLVEVPFNAAEFSYAFLEAFGNKTATLQRLRSVGKNTTNKTDVVGEDVVAVLQRNNIHLATCPSDDPDAVADLLKRLADSPATGKHKVKFVLATDGQVVHAASLNSDDPPLVCKFKELADHFGYFLELAGISTVRQIRENAFDIKATGRLNRLYVELLRTNPDWDGDERREELNHFFARLIFCFFAEDTGIFNGDCLFTETVQQMSDPSGENTDLILSDVFRAMDLSMKDREASNLRSWARQFPYVNGGLFGNNGSKSARSTVPKFTQIARSYLLHIGSLDWTQINPDIFGSMIQAVADDEERGALGMHYTSVPNILKVLNPLFLDDLHAQLKEASNNPRKLLNLRKRLARIRVFDPACGSGNFLVIAYKQMRAIEAEINILRGEPERASEIPLTNFRGIELRHFAVEIARLALIIAEYQCDELYRGQRLALAEFLPLNRDNWITHGNALRLDWLNVCPPTGTGGLKLVEDDLFQTPLDQSEIDFENEGGETYICGNPPYKGQSEQTLEQKKDLEAVCNAKKIKWKNLDYVAGWIIKFLEYPKSTRCQASFVTTNSIFQGQQPSILWPAVKKAGIEIAFARTSFKWSNLAKHQAGVTVAIAGFRSSSSAPAYLYDGSSSEVDEKRMVSMIGPYLVPNSDTVVEPSRVPLNALPRMDYGSKPADGGGLLLSSIERSALSDAKLDRFVRPYVGSDDYIDGKRRYCLWVDECNTEEALRLPFVRTRAGIVRDARLRSPKAQTFDLALKPLRFAEVRFQYCAEGKIPLVVPIHSSSERHYLPAGALPDGAVVSNAAFGVYNAPIYCLALVVSRLHLVWIATVCGKIKTDYRYSNTLGWNTFPVPLLTEENKAELSRCTENILLAREAHWPATIAEMYNPETMPPDLRSAHDRNDETLERVYIGRRFKNDTERLEVLFQLYNQMTAKKKP